MSGTEYPINIHWVKLVGNIVIPVMCLLSNIERKELKSPTLILDLSGYFCNTLNSLKFCYGMQLSFLERNWSSYVLLL